MKLTDVQCPSCLNHDVHTCKETTEIFSCFHCDSCGHGWQARKKPTRLDAHADSHAKAALTAADFGKMQQSTKHALASGDYRSAALIASADEAEAIAEAGILAIDHTRRAIAVLLEQHGFAAASMFVLTLPADVLHFTNPTPTEPA